ncbi:hypothetical protein [Phyllobacterium sp. P5_D12]
MFAPDRIAVKHKLAYYSDIPVNAYYALRELALLLNIFEGWLGFVQVLDAWLAWRLVVYVDGCLTFECVHVVIGG